MGEIFKAYDIRGIYPSDINEDIAYKIGKAYSDILRTDSNNNGITLVVGRDMRISSPQLTKHLIKGITDQGINVIDIGLASTPTFYFGVSILNVDGGLQVSASHNPKEYNGIKVVGRKAFPVGYDTGLSKIKEKIFNNNFGKPIRKGSATKELRILEREVDYSLKQSNPDKINKMKVVADTANAMGSLYLSELFKYIPCELIKMNFELDGSFPVHEADPFKKENIKDLMYKVVEEKADMGIATDGDGDRIFFVDEKGNPVEPAILNGIMSKIILQESPGATICYDIRPGRITRDMIEENGGRPVITKVGHTLIKIKALQENAAFAGESSGHFFFKKEIGLFEMPMIAVLKLMEYLSSTGKKLSEIVEPLRKYYHSGEISSVVEDKDSKIKQIAEKYNEGKISWLDGISIEYDDFWFNVRPSNTEPLLRLNVEAVSEEKMIKIRDEILNIIRG